MTQEELEANCFVCPNSYNCPVYQYMDHARMADCLYQGLIEEPCEEDLLMYKQLKKNFPALAKTAEGRAILKNLLNKTGD